MSNGREYEKPCTYQFKVKGTITHDWSDWFEGFSISQQPGDETLLTGEIMDQAALYGLLATIARLGIPLLSVTRLEFSPEIPRSITKERGENKNESDH